MEGTMRSVLVLCLGWALTATVWHSIFATSGPAGLREEGHKMGRPAMQEATKQPKDVF